MRLQKPFLKWVGGKTQIIGDIIDKIPNEINNYHEIFLGGGSVLLAILSLARDKKINIKEKVYAYDLNESLINVYNNIKLKKDEIYNSIESLWDVYDNLEGSIINRNPKNIDEGKTSKESYYYWIRKRFNEIEKNSAEQSAMFIFLNKTGFRGLYREGPNGFNVPYGHYKKTPQMISREELYNISKLIKNVEFTCLDFNESISKVKKNDFVYLDPPYAPETGRSFVGYTKDGFDLRSHKNLFNKIKSKKHIKFVMSNAKVDVVMDHFNDYKCEDVIARRAINSKNPESITTEVIISN
jgi:DNA adenine methylase